MNRALLIGRAIGSKVEYNGGEYGAARVKRMVHNVLSNFEVIDIDIQIPNLLTKFFNILFCKSYGCTQKTTSYLKSTLSRRTELAFFNGSIYGTYVHMLHKKGIKTAVFYHNVESNYYFDKYQSKKSVLNYLMYRYIHKQEEISTQNADIVITLNKRDSLELLRLYNREANFNSPTSYSSIPENQLKADTEGKDYILFVGGDFYANIDGITDFIKNALPKLDIDLYVVGSCCNSLIADSKIMNNQQVFMKGFVEDISGIYEAASAVICPIYSGSGMKTKTVEALKYGKYVFATPEAFEGITADFNKIGGLCCDNSEFVDKLTAWKAKRTGKFNQYSYELFMSTFTNEVVEKDFSNNLKSFLNI